MLIEPRTMISERTKIALVQMRCGAEPEKNLAHANQPKILWELSGGHSEPLTDRPLFLAGLEKLLQLVEAHQKREAIR